MFVALFFAGEILPPLPTMPETPIYSASVKLISYNVYELKLDKSIQYLILKKYASMQMCIYYYLLLYNANIH
jgi:hypothetical protein